MKLQDKDKATTDAWFFAVYTTISEFERMPIMASEDVGHKFSAVVSSSLRDEATETVVRLLRTFRACSHVWRPTQTLSNRCQPL